MTKYIVISALLLISTLTINAQEKAGKKDTAHNAVYYTCPMHPNVKSDKAGKCPKCGMDLALSKKEQMKAEVVKLYSCPMHADVTSASPGKCSKCGMDMVERKAKPKSKKVQS
jgi:hypothetical protein